jgi:pimeloyl-ACP methyl ester carboxylesterase
LRRWELKAPAGKVWGRVEACRKMMSNEVKLAKTGDHAMSADSALTVPTRFVEAGGIRFAHRRWGKPGGIPLVFINYFTGNLDDWDPQLTDGFAADHDVILFDNAGVASSGGETPGTVAEMTRHALSFCDALGLKQFDVVGFSLGGMIAQQTALDHPDRVIRIVLVGTGPRGGEGMTFTELSAEEQADPARFLLAAFFSPSDASQAAGRAYLKRLAARTHDRDVPVSNRTAEAQLRAIREWGTVPSSNRDATLKKIKHPTLVVHGTKDVVVPPVNAFILAEQLPDAQLILYPDSSHGAQSQHAELFLQHAKLFLSA